MTDDRLVTLEGWKAGLLDEVLFRTASHLSDRGAPDGNPSVQTELQVNVSVSSDGALLLRIDSVVDGPIVTSLAPPFLPAGPDVDGAQCGGGRGDR